jgi:hypothetical protein
MKTITLRYGKGYAGKLGNKAWIAKITGTDSQYGLARVFLDSDRAERERFNRAKTIVDLSWDLTEGVYESSESGERKFFIIYNSIDGQIEYFEINESRALSIAQMLDGGMDFSAARIKSKPSIR